MLGPLHRMVSSHERQGDGSVSEEAQPPQSTVTDLKYWPSSIPAHDSHSAMTDFLMQLPCVDTCLCLLIITLIDFTQVSTLCSLSARCTRT